MGFLFLESFGDKETMIIEEIAKDLKVSVEIVAKYYKEMKEAIKNEIKD